MSTYSKTKIRIVAADLPDNNGLTSMNVLIPMEQKPLPFGEKAWATVFLDYCARLAKLKLSGQQWQVLMRLLSIMSYGQRAEISQTILAKDLEISTPRVSEAIRALVNAEVLIEDVKIGTSRIYRLNSNFVFRGKTRFARAQQLTDATEVNSLRYKRDRERVVAMKVSEILGGRSHIEVFEEIERDFESSWESTASGWELIREIAEKVGVKSPY
jgi:hypothetical protein